MEKKETSKKIINFFNLIVVILVIIAAYAFRSRIEKYTVTGYIGVFIACFTANATILLPAPGILVVIQYAQFLNPVLVVMAGGLGTSAGEMIGYLLGRTGKEVININTNRNVFKWFGKRPYLTIFVFSVIPLPLFDIVGIVSGMTKVNPILFWCVCLIGKLIKMTVYVVLYTYAKELFLNYV